MIVDSFIHVGNSLYKNGALPEELFNAMKSIKADKAVICPVKPLTYDLSLANNFIVKLIENYRGKLIGLVRIDPNIGEEAIKEIKWGLSLGLKGVYLNPWEETFQVNDPLVYPIMEIAKNYDVPVMIEGGYPWVSHASQVGDLAKKFKEVKIILTNTGQLDLSGFSEADVNILMESTKNVYLIANGALGEELLTHIVKNLSEKRVIFGSGFPMMEPKLEILRIKYLSKISEIQKQKILSENTLELFKEKA